MSNTFRTLDDLCRIPSSAPTTRETADHAELAACPFCGLTDSADNATQEAGVSVRPFRSPAGGTACRVECACGASGPSKREDWAATEVWNRRDPQSALLSEIAALRGERDANWQEYLEERSARMDAGTREYALGERLTQVERQRDELRGEAVKGFALIHTMLMTPSVPRQSAGEVANTFLDRIANQGADPAPVKKERAWICPQDNTPCPPECDSDDRRHCASVACKEQPA